MKLARRCLSGEILSLEQPRKPLIWMSADYQQALNGVIRKQALDVGSFIAIVKLHRYARA